MRTRGETDTGDLAFSCLGVEGEKGTVFYVLLVEFLHVGKAWSYPDKAFRAANLREEHLVLSF